MNIQSQHYARDLRKYYRLPATQISLTVVLSVVIMSVFIVFALRPTIVAIVTLQKMIVESRKTLGQLESKVAILQKASDQLETIKSVLPILNLRIANSGAEYEPLVVQMEAIATQTGVQIQSDSLGSTLLYSRIISPFKPQKNEVVVTLPLSARVTGSYPAVVAFLTQIMSLERVISINSAVITKEASSRGENIVVSLSIDGEAYYLADEAQLKSALQDKKGR